MTNDSKIQEIRSVLNIKWNPVGLSLAATDDEYDEYIKYIVQRRDWQEKELVDYLIYVENKRIGLSINAERKQVASVAAKEIMAVIVKWR